MLPYIPAVANPKRLRSVYRRDAPEEIQFHSSAFAGWIAETSLFEAASIAAGVPPRHPGALARVSLADE